MHSFTGSDDRLQTKINADGDREIRSGPIYVVGPHIGTVAFPHVHGDGNEPVTHTITLYGKGF